MILDDLFFSPKDTCDAALDLGHKRMCFSVSFWFNLLAISIRYLETPPRLAAC